jgi:hypothetical protein
MVTDLPPLVKKEIEDKKKILGDTKIQQEKYRKKNIGETMDKLDEIGQPNEKKGAQATMKAYREFELENKAVKSDRIEWLNAKSKFAKTRIDYYRNVKTLVDYELSYLELPPNYTISAKVTDKGIRFLLKDRFGNLHLGGFTPSGLGLYDEQACRSSVNRIDDLITKLEKSPPNGIYLS